MNCAAPAAGGIGGSARPPAVSRGQTIGAYTGVKAESSASGDYVLFVRGSVAGAPDGADFCIDARACGSTMRFLNGADGRSVANVEFAGPVQVLGNGLIGVRVVALRAIAPHVELEVFYGPDYVFSA